MSLVETLHREHLQRRIRMMQAALNYQERSMPKAIVVPLPIAKEIAPAPPAPEPVILESYSPASLRVETIRKAVAQHFGVRKHDLLSDRRTANLVVPRQMIFYLCRRLTHFSLPIIGRAMGRRDHTTVLHGVRQIAKKIETDEQLRASIEMLTEQLGGEPE